MLAVANSAERLPAVGSEAEPLTAVRYAAKLVFQNWRYVLFERTVHLDAVIRLDTLRCSSLCAGCCRHLPAMRTCGPASCAA